MDEKTAAEKEEERILRAIHKKPTGKQAFVQTKSPARTASKSPSYTQIESDIQNLATSIQTNLNTGTASSGSPMSKSGSGATSWREQQKENERRQQEENQRRAEYLKKQNDLIKAKRQEEENSSSAPANNEPTPAPAPTPSSPPSEPVKTAAPPKISTPVKVEEPKPAPSPVVSTPTPSVSAPPVQSAPAPVPSSADPVSKRLSKLLPLISQSIGGQPVDLSKSSGEVSGLAKEFIKLLSEDFDLNKFFTVNENLVEQVRRVGETAEKSYGHADARKELNSVAESFIRSEIAFLDVGEDLGNYMSSSGKVAQNRQQVLLELSKLIKSFQPCFDTSTDKCAKCSKPIDEDFIKVDESCYHTDCFTCERCNKPITAYFQADGKIFCEEDYRAYTIENKTAVICHGCNQLITGQFMKYDNFTYHKDCFKCSQCQKSITGKFFEVEEEGAANQPSSIVCEKCAQEQQ